GQGPGARRRLGGPARAEGVRPALGAPRPPRPRPDARPAPRARLGLHLRGRHAYRRRPRAPAPAQARRRLSDRDRLGRRLQGLARARGHGKQHLVVLRSLRFRLPALFLASIVLSGLVAAAIAFPLLDDYTLSRARAELNREAAGLNDLYAYWIVHSNYALPAEQLAHASGDRLYHIPAHPAYALFPKQTPRFVHLSRRTVSVDALRRGKTLESK